MSKKAKAKKAGAAKKASGLQEPSTLTQRDIVMGVLEPHIGSTFSVTMFAGRDDLGMVHPGVEVDLTLILCEPAKGDRGGVKIDHPEVVERDPFVAVFKGPDNFPFSDDMYSLSHPTLGVLKDISMSVDKSAENSAVTLLSAHFL